MSLQDWQIQRFADIADYKAGKTPARARPEYWQNTQNGVPWVTISDMTEFGIVTETKEKITKAAFQQIFRGTTVPAGTLIMSFKLTIGRVATLGIDACQNEAIISIYPKKGIDQRFLGYFLSQVNYDSLQDRQVKGNTLNRDKIDRIEVCVPPLNEQVYIANVLDLLRRAITINEDIVKAGSNLKRAAMRELFSRGLRGEPQKETEIGPVPESWAVHPLGKLCEQTETVNLKHDGERTIEYVDVSSVSREFLTIETTSQFVLREAPSRARKRILKGDVIFATVRPTLLRTAYVSAELDNQVCSTAFCVLRRNVEKVSDKFLYYLIQRDQFIGQLAGVEGGASYPAVTDRIVKEQFVPVPSISEQREIVSILEAIDRKIDLHRRKRMVLDDLFKALLHKLMTGEIRVADLDLPTTPQEDE